MAIDAVQGPHLDAATLAPDAHPHDDVGLDALNFLNVVAAIHDATGVDVPERDDPKTTTIEASASYLAEAMAR